MKFILGQKVGMTQVYSESGAVQPVTILEAAPCTVTQIKTADRDGYQAVQIGCGSRKQIAKPTLGHLKPSGLKSVAALREIRINDPKNVSELTIGTELTVNQFSPGDPVTVSATSKGKGFAGVVKRHGFAGGPATHGSDHHRAPGSIGSQGPQRIPKGRRMAGHMGASRVTIKGLKVIRIDLKANLLALSGAIPGPRRGLVEIRG